MYNLFLDDVRDPNKFLDDVRSWVIVRNYNSFVRTIEKEGLPAFISFDHDLAWEHYPKCDVKIGVISYDSYRERTGYDCAKWLVEFCMKTEQALPEFQVHSMNPVGKRNIEVLLSGYKKTIQNTDYL